MIKILIALLFACLFQASCSKKEAFNSKDYALLLSSTNNNERAAIANKNIVIDSSKTTDIIFKNRAKISGDIISNIVFFGDYFYFIDDSFVLSKHSSDNLTKELSVKIKFNRLEKQKFSKIFLTVDKSYIYILTNFGKLVCLSKDDLSVEYEIALNNSFNSQPVSESFYLYLKASDGQIYTLFSSNGKTLWSYKMNEPIQTSYDLTSSVLLSPNYLLIPTSQFKITLLSKTNGDLITSLNNAQGADNDSDSFKISGITKSDLFFKSSDQIISIKNNIDNINIDDYKDEASHFYLLGDDSFSSFDLKTISLLHSQQISKINNAQPFANGFIATSSINELYFIDPFAKQTNLLYKFSDLHKNLNSNTINIASIKSTTDNKYFVFISADQTLYLLTKDGDNMSIVKTKTLLEKIKNSQNNSGSSKQYKKINFNNINFISTHGENLYVFDSGMVYRFTNF